MPTLLDSLPDGVGVSRTPGRATSAAPPAPDEPHRHARGEVADSERKFGRFLARYRCAEPGCEWVSDWQGAR